MQVIHSANKWASKFIKDERMCYLISIILIESSVVLKIYTWKKFININLIKNNFVNLIILMKQTNNI